MLIGHAGSQYNLGNLYSEGRGVPRDSVAAMRLYKSAAEQDHSAAQAALAVGYLKGEGVEQDEAQADGGPCVRANKVT